MMRKILTFKPKVVEVKQREIRKRQIFDLDLNLHYCRAYKTDALAISNTQTSYKKIQVTLILSNF